ncbi:MAG TPA: ATP-binding protein [Clostridia bacterium]|nr:ATP-binding protein [Clostridia bacterium]
MLRILQLEDDPVDSQLALRLLRDAGLDVEIERVHTLVAFKRSLAHKPFALILADYTVPGVDALKALEWARQAQPDVPFVFLSGTLGEDVAIETLKLGATDYVLKQRINRLVPAVRRALHEAKEQLHRKQAEQELRESEGRYRALLELAPDAVVVYQDWRFVYVNAAALRLCGATAFDAMWGKAIFDFFPIEEREIMRQSGQRLLEGATMPIHETRVLRLDDSEVTVEVAGRRVEWLGRSAVQTILWDVTERKRIQHELQAAREQLLHTNADLERTVQERSAELQEAIEDLHRFSYTIMHDMRGPLRAMHGFANMLQLESVNCTRARNAEFLQRIVAAAQRLDSLIQDALNYARILEERLPVGSVDLNSLLCGIIESYPNLQPTVADIVIEGTLPKVIGNEATLTQCFSNLLGNAVKFVAPGIRPCVRIWSENLASQPSAQTEMPAKSRVRIWLQDNGIGIAPEHQAHIFEMFHRLNQHYAGTGIGLAIVRKVVERMGGRVGVESQVGHGSRFWLDLPCASQGLSASPPGTIEPMQSNEFSKDPRKLG